MLEVPHIIVPLLEQAKVVADVQAPAAQPVPLHVAEAIP